MATSQAAEPAPAAATLPGLPRTAAPPGASVYIISPRDGETVSSPVKVVFGLTGMGVAPAGVDMPGTGHHHILIDTALPANLAMPLPADEHHVHFGKGQTEAMVTLPAGKHTLQLVLGDKLHVPFDPVVASTKITVTVK
ncbi:MAG: DUF4399 domain-containing protein [Steroidobacteraceae bacterium]